MSRPVQPNKSWNGDDKDGFSRRQSNAHKLSSISYPGLGGDAAPGPSHAQHPDPSARIPPRAVSAPAAFSPQAFSRQPLPSTSTQPPIATLSTHIVVAAPQHQAQTPQGIAFHPHPESYRSGKWCWVDLPNVGWIWAWSPNIPPQSPIVAPEGTRFVPHQQAVSYGTGGPLTFRPAAHTGGRWRYVEVKSAGPHGRWYWVQAWVPYVPPYAPPEDHTVVEWAYHGPPPL
ncbi:hypothetical protein PENSPDRAFT_680088 [Peniophora sp. CONT]|nr:hypothetical protein PENSPDRAFT_680088 [Peniophora sp. CONT]